MHITDHAVKMYQERITSEHPEVIRSFIKRDVSESEHLYQVNNIEKRTKDGIVYVIDQANKKSPVVITLYLNKRGE